MEQRVRILSWSIALSAILVVVVIGSAAFGPVTIDPFTVALAMLNSIALPGIGVTSMTLPMFEASIPRPRLHTVRPFHFEIDRTHQIIVEHVRMPRILLAATVGFALAAAGTVMQGFFRNPLADPSIIGVSTGAAAGAVAALAFPMLVPFGSIHVPAFLGAIGTAFLVYAIATEGGRTPVATLLLAGIAVQAFLGAAISYMLVHSGQSLRQAVIWMMGHLHNTSWSDVGFALPVTILGVAILGMYTRELNVLLLGEEEAHHLGIDVERTKLLLLTLASIITAAGVAVAGVIGFVGLVVPHIMRLIVGPDHRILLPTSALAGASFLVVTDTIARAGPAEVPVGIITAAFGAPFFLYLLKRQEVYGL